MEPMFVVCKNLSADFIDVNPDETVLFCVSPDKLPHGQLVDLKALIIQSPTSLSSVVISILIVMVLLVGFLDRDSPCEVMPLLDKKVSRSVGS